MMFSKFRDCLIRKGLLCSLLLFLSITFIGCEWTKTDLLEDEDPKKLGDVYLEVKTITLGNAKILEVYIEQVVGMPEAHSFSLGNELGEWSEMQPIGEMNYQSTFEQEVLLLLFSDTGQTLAQASIIADDLVGSLSLIPPSKDIQSVTRDYDHLSIIDHYEILAESRVLFGNYTEDVPFLLFYRNDSGLFIIDDIAYDFHYAFNDEEKFDRIFSEKLAEKNFTIDHLDLFFCLPETAYFRDAKTEERLTHQEREDRVKKLQHFYSSTTDPFPFAQVQLEGHREGNSYLYQTTIADIYGLPEATHYSTDLSKIAPLGQTLTSSLREERMSIYLLKSAQVLESIVGENGSILAFFNQSFEEEPFLSSFTAYYKSLDQHATTALSTPSLIEGSHLLPLAYLTWDSQYPREVYLRFEPFPAIAEDMRYLLILQYEGGSPVQANESFLVPKDLSSLQITASSSQLAGEVFHIEISQGTNSDGEVLGGKKTTVVHSNLEGEVFYGEISFTYGEANTPIILTKAGEHLLTAQVEDVAEEAALTIEILPAAVNDGAAVDSNTQVILKNEGDKTTGVSFDLLVTVEDTFGNTITNLVKEDFAVYDTGQNDIDLIDVVLNEEGLYQMTVKKNAVERADIVVTAKGVEIASRAEVNIVSTATVSNAEELRSAIRSKNVTSILFAADIEQDLTGDYSIAHPLSMDLSTFTLTGDVVFAYDHGGTSSLSGLQDPYSILGSLRVATPVASFENSAAIRDTVTIEDIASSTWREEAKGNTLILTNAKGATITIVGRPSSVTIGRESSGDIHIAVLEGASVDSIIMDAPTKIEIWGSIGSLSVTAPTTINAHKGSSIALIEATEYAPVLIIGEVDLAVAGDTVIFCIDGKVEVSTLQQLRLALKNEDVDTIRLADTDVFTADSAITMTKEETESILLPLTIDGVSSGILIELHAVAGPLHGIRSGENVTIKVIPGEPFSLEALDLDLEIGRGEDGLILAKVIDEHRNPVPDVMVLVKEDGGLLGIQVGDSAVTDEEGVATFTLVEERSGEYQVELALKDNETIAVSLKVMILETSFAGGDGSISNPFQIATAHDLSNVRHHLDAHFILVDSIDLDVAPYNTGFGWDPIGSDVEEAFTGSFDGNGYSIHHLFINRPSANRVGLFAKTGEKATLLNIELSYVHIRGHNTVGSLVGENSGAITNCHSKGHVEGLKETGGLVGHNRGVISTSSVDGSLLGTVENTGGFVGLNDGLIEKSYSRGSVYSRSRALGGLVGFNRGGTISDSYSTSSVSGNQSNGGLVGMNDGSIIYCYSIGEVDGNRDTGGLVGQNTGAVMNSYYDRYTAGLVDTGKGIPKTTAEMVQQGTYAAEWDFESIWSIEEGESYPYLQWQDRDTIPYRAAVETPSVVGAETNELGTIITIAFSKTMADPKGQQGSFRFNDGAIRAFRGATLAMDDSSKIDLVVEGEAIESEKTVTVSYVAGDVKSSDGGDLDSFADLAVTNRALPSMYNGNLESYRGRNGELFTFTIMGTDASNVFVWGTDLYSDDSHLGKAAVHAGLVEVGEIKAVTVMILPGDTYYEGSTRNGITTASWDMWDGSFIFVDPDFLAFAWGGDGSASAPYLIATLKHLDNVREYLDSHFKVIASLDFAVFDRDGDEKGWKPIGSYYEPFTSSFDGNGYMISNLWINDPDLEYVGLFGFVSGDTASLKNISLLNVDVKGSKWVGGLVGYNDGGVISKSYTTGLVTGYSYVGGLVGSQSYGAIGTSYSACSVIGSGEKIGGLVGQNSSGSITKSYSVGAVLGEDFTGGLVGDSRRASIVSSSYAIGDVTGQSYVGGLLGSSEGAVRESYSMGKTKGNAYVGGLLGYLEPDGSISTSYSAGFVHGDTDTGGFVGYNGGAENVFNSYWDMEVSTYSTSDGGSGKTTCEMLQQSTFMDWNFEEIWAIEEGTSYPYLQWQVTTSHNYPEVMCNNHN